MPRRPAALFVGVILGKVVVVQPPEQMEPGFPDGEHLQRFHKRCRCSSPDRGQSVRSISKWSAGTPAACIYSCNRFQLQSHRRGRIPRSCPCSSPAPRGYPRCARRSMNPSSSSQPCSSFHAENLRPEWSLALTPINYSSLSMGYASRRLNYSVKPRITKPLSTLRLLRDL